MSGTDIITVAAAVPLAAAADLLLAAVDDDAVAEGLLRSWQRELRRDREVQP